MIGHFAWLETPLHWVNKIVEVSLNTEVFVEDLSHDFVDLAEYRDCSDGALGGVFCVFFGKCHESGSVDVGGEFASSDPGVEGLGDLVH